MYVYGPVPSRRLGRSLAIKKAVVEIVADLAEFEAAVIVSINSDILGHTMKFSGWRLRRNILRRVHTI